MGLFSRKEKETSVEGRISGEDEVLGNLDELIRQRVPLEIISGDKRWRCNLYEINEKSRMVRISDDPTIWALDGKTVKIGFPLDRTWFEFSTRIVAQEGKPHLVVPDAIVRRERRKDPRTRLAARENVTVTVLESLGRGRGALGNVVDIGPAALGFDITRAMILETEKEIQPNDELFSRGQKLMLCRVKGVPGISTLECEAEVLRLQRYMGKWRLTIKLVGMPGNYQRALRDFIEPRVLDYDAVHRSWKKKKEMEAQREAESPREADSQPLVADSGPKTTVRREAETGVAEVEAEAAKPSIENKVFKIANQIPKGTTIFSFGDELKENLAFLKGIWTVRWEHSETPLQFSRSLRTNRPDFLLISLEFNKQSVIEYLEKLAVLGVLRDVKIILLSDAGLTPSQLVKCKMLGVRNMLKLPLENPEQLLEKLIG